MASSLKVKRDHPDAKLPERRTPDAAGYDLFALSSGDVSSMGRKLVHTGLKAAIPEGYYGRVAPRSGLALKNGIDVFAGVIDSDYRGEIGIILFNSSNEVFKYNQGDAIAQLILTKIITPEVIEVEELNETERGECGFGSTDTLRSATLHSSKNSEELDCINVGVKLLHPQARIPVKVPSSSMYKLFAVESGIIPVSGTVQIRTGLYIEMPKYYCGEVVVGDFDDRMISPQMINNIEYYDDRELVITVSNPSFYNNITYNIGDIIGYITINKLFKVNFVKK